ncbi:ferredoxin reductase [Hoyosella rhizosphaerae]|uniref:Stearoyl-CoA 9-desaturase n=1 Tax=Hoyosella rhizosphaerae TaxID=1755582 RepID=A0A916XEA8_9ACTN|nr:ferredoxin reductase [Hoyosella rhizosphaerae]MBN4925879.1 ferredoxin reductase [Hoyosella rhizosphaerae]GGC67228.1 stearoyl-CoA 9-desaturase [Hoyosella rhizosphaerae]
MVERAATPVVPTMRRKLLRAGKALTNPLLPDDYLALINPMWSTRELQGQIVRVKPETPRSATIVIKPNFPWPGHKAGQYLRIGAEINGVRHWRAYTLTSDPNHPEGHLSISVRTVEGGRMSTFFTRNIQRGATVFLGEVEGTFCLPHPLPKKFLMFSAGSGVTPIFSLIRELARRGALSDVVHLHCEHTPDEIMFDSIFNEVESHFPGYHRSIHLSEEKGVLTPQMLDDLCPDWRERETFLSGPPGMLDAMSSHWSAEGVHDRLSMEHFQPFAGDGGSGGLGDGGTVHFRVTDIQATCDGATSILVGGEEAGGTLPFGCRMGVCHTCIGRLEHGQVRDLRTGVVHGSHGQMVRTCINAPEGHVEIDL